MVIVLDPMPNPAPILGRLLQLLVLLAACGAAMAHGIRPAVASLTLGPPARYELAIVVNLEAVVAGIGSEHRDTDQSPNARE